MGNLWIVFYKGRFRSDGACILHTAEWATDLIEMIYLPGMWCNLYNERYRVLEY